jgi:hypothetical protein
MAEANRLGLFHAPGSSGREIIPRFVDPRDGRLTDRSDS